MNTSKDHSGCRGCQWRGANHGGWCYMFESEPSNLPCAQHDKFQIERDITQAFLRKHPEMLALLIQTEKQ